MKLILTLLILNVSIISIFSQNSCEVKTEQTASKGDSLSHYGFSLIPTPQEVFIDASQQCRVTAVFPITGDAQLTEAVQSVLSERLGKAIPMGSGGIGVSLPRDLTDDVWTHEQSYIITVAPNAINIEARTPRAAYYAAQTLAQLIEQSDTIPSLTIRDWPAIPNRMVMIALDQGAFQVIDVDYWKRLIRELSAMKINAIMPYFDAGGTFKFSKHPYMGIKGDDGFTVEKAKLLSEYAHQHFIELIPQQNSLGHLGSLFEHEELKHLRDGGGTINMILPETFTLMGELYDDLVEGFPYARSIHVGGDEFSGGFGKNPLVAERIKEIGTPAIYAQYLMKLRQMLKERNRGMMIWENHTGVTLEAKDMLAKDIALFDWRYFSRKLYPSLDRILEAGFSNVWATPAVTRYYGGTNDWIRAFQNISSFAIYGADRKVPGMCTCTWVHGIWGGRNIFELNLYGLAYSAQSGWNPNYKINTEEFASNYARHWFGYRNSDAAELIMQAIHMPYGKPEEQGFWHENQGLEPICGEPLAKLAKKYSDTTAIRNLDYTNTEVIRNEVYSDAKMIRNEAKTLLDHCGLADAALNKLRAGATRNQVTLDYLAHDIRIHRLASKRILMALEINSWVHDLEQYSDPKVNISVPPGMMGELLSMVATHKVIEATFKRSVYDAGGGSLDAGSLNKGAIEFRSKEGREDLEYIITNLQANSLPKSFVE